MILNGVVTTITCPAGRVKGYDGAMQAKKPSPYLNRMYARFNALYYKGNLPPVPNYWWDFGNSHEAHYLAIARTVRGIVVIRHNVLLRPFTKVVAGNMLHEMAHIATWDERAEHGTRWQAEMRRLLRAGAFDTIL